MSGALSGLVVIDLAERALIAGHMLAQLGAHVTQVRSHARAADARPDFAWLAYGAGKRLALLDLDDADDRGRLAARIATADILLESEAPGRMDALGLGFDALRAANPGLIHVSITPFGSSGPKAHWRESDLILWAAGGPLLPSRDGDRAPLRISVPQAWRHAGADAAGGALIAHYARTRSGLGQHIDISVQQSVTQATLAATIADAVGHEHFSFGTPSKKALDLSGSGARTRRSKWPLADGLLEMHLGLGHASGDKTNNFFAWMREEGALPERLHGWNWVTMPAALSSGEISDEDMEEARAAVAAFLVTKPKAIIVEEAMRRRIMMAPVYTTQDLVDSPHHAARGFFQRVDHSPAASVPSAPSILLPGDFAQGMAEGFAPPAPAPDKEAEAPPPSARVGAAGGDAGLAAPFAGLKILDLAWVVAGPAIGRVLADYGATVVRVESSKRVDTARAMGPFPNGRPDLDRSGCYETYNAGKLGLALDLAREEARVVIRDLVAWADVVIESFAPGQMERWGLGYAALKTIKPDIVMLSTSLMGQSGPYAAFAGFGNIGAAMSGFQALVGWPDAPPIGPFGPYTDYVGPRFGLVALLAALKRRRDTGEGAWLDVSQAEAGIQFLAPEIAEYSVSGHVAQVIGNRDRTMAPHGVFQCAGEDRWIAIAIANDEDWARLAPLIGGEALEPGFATLPTRLAEQDRLERILSDWTAGQRVEDLEARLQTAGIAAHRASSSADMVADPQLIDRGQFVRLPHEGGGESVVEASRFALSRTPAVYRGTAPSFGRDNRIVLADILGYDDVHIDRLGAAGILV
ncbi:MAG: CoA transferase [Sphingobium sp.]